jgi:hypothetical protein
LQAILIDPRINRISLIDLPKGDAIIKAMHKTIGADTLDHTRISDKRDYLWCDDGVFSRGQPCFAFKLKGVGPFGGRCIIIGADEIGEDAEPYITVELLLRTVEWLGEIVPEVTWISEQIRPGVERQRAVITYKRTQ